MEKEDKTTNGMVVHYMNIEELIPADYNPRRITPEDRRNIKASLEKFGFAEPVIINQNPQRKNIIVGGHQRVTVAKEELGYTEVPCVFVNLDLKEEKELNVRLNKNHGRWDNDKLQEHFNFDFLKYIGFTNSDLSFWLSDYAKKFNSITNNNCDMPVVPKFSEKYACVVIISTNEIDTSYLKTALKIDKCKSYKNSRTGEGMVISVEHFKKAIDGSKD